MPTTSYTDATFGARTIGARTDSGGTPVTDLSAEEDRYPTIILSEGYVTPSDAFEPVAGAVATMNVIIGSGSAKADYYVVAGNIAGQGNYMVRLASATETITLDAADGSNDRIDEIYLVVEDNAYDSSGRALPRFGERKGDPAGSPSAPGPDANWDAYVLIATIDVPQGAADITECTITDERLASQLAVASIGLSSAGGIDAGGGAITNVGDVDGVDVGSHTHDGTAGDGAQIDANDLTNLQAAVNAANVDADTLDGSHATAFAAASHVGAGGAAHAAATTSVDGFMSAADKTKLDGVASGATANQTITAGSGIDVTDGAGAAPTVAHEDTSSQGSVNNSGATVIQDVTLDGFGHVTALGSKTLSAADVGAATSGHNHDSDYYQFEAGVT